MYGKFHHETYEFREAIHDLFSIFFEKNKQLSMPIHNEIIDLRNEIIVLLKSWIGTKIIEKKFGIEMPLNITKPIAAALPENQDNVRREYKPCEICGESRCVDFCHIIPRENGGSANKGNLVSLCPTHHFLFDQCRLNKQEWDKLDFSNKNVESIKYAQNIILLMLKNFWNYGTNKFCGCKCGGMEFNSIIKDTSFGFKVKRLICKQCGEECYNFGEVK